MRRFAVHCLILILLLQASGCGTLLHPERRGQTSGRIDPAIAILDGVGLLVFLVPGLIAFGIDFATGAIYLPGTGGASAEVRVIEFDTATAGANELSALVSREAGAPIDLRNPDVRVLRVGSRAELLAQLN